MVLQDPIAIPVLAAIATNELLTVIVLAMAVAYRLLNRLTNVPFDGYLQASLTVGDSPDED